MSSTNLRSILDAALDSYAKQTGIDLSRHPSADKLQSCATSEDVIQLLRDRETTFKDYRDKHHKLINCLCPVVKVVHAFSGVLGEVASLVPFQPTKAIFVGVDVLLSTAIGVSASYDALVDLFDCIGNFLARLHIYTEKIPLAPTMSDILVKIMAEVLGVLAVATKQIKQGRFTKFAKKLLGESDIEAILQRLDRLTHEEARMTAAHTLEVVYGLVYNLKIVVDDGEASSEGIRRALVGIQDMADEINKMKRDQLQEKIRNWLHQPDPSTNHNIALRQRHDGTALWFTKGSTFKEWRMMGSLLWIHGKPGSGKSVICSSIIQEIERLHDTGLALMTYFYCDFKDNKKQDIAGILASLVAQLSAKSDPCYEILGALYSKYDAGSRQPNEDALIECLKSMLHIEGQPPIYIIVDAIDECPNSTDVVSPRDRVLVFVENLIKLHLPNIHICVTSRPEMDIRAALESLATHTISLHDQSGQRDDIADYVKFVVHSDRNMRKWRSEDKTLVIETLSQKADGMFRWIVCQLAMLRRCIPATIRRALDDLPKSLDETYERILLSIGEERWEYAQRLFQCLAVSFRPLRVDELAEILAIQFDAGSLPNYDAMLRPEDSEEAVLSTCSSLIMIVNVKGLPVVQFSHFSVKEYLMSERLATAGKGLSRYHILQESAHTVLVRASLSVLLSIDDEVDKNRMKDFPLAVYAARYWADHAQVENVSSNIEDTMVLLFDSTRSRSHFSTWVWIYDIDHPFREVLLEDHPTPPEAAPLYYATLCGSLGIVRRLVVTCSHDVNARGGFYSTPLHAAIAKGNLEIAQVLLGHHADVTASDNHTMSPLHWASRRGYRDGLELLLKHHTDVNIRDGKGRTPLIIASQYGQLNVAHLLLRSGAAVDIKDEAGFTPLMSASRHGYPDIVRLLLQSGAAVDARDNCGWTPLLSASRYGRPDIARLLLDSGAAIDPQNKDGWTPLHCALRNGHLGIVRSLLDSGAAVDIQNEDGWTPLQFASRHGYQDIVRSLLDSGAAVDPHNKRGWTPLQTASRNGHPDIVRLLLDSGAAVDSQNENGWTPLMSASRYGYPDIVRLLIDSGAAVDFQNKDGWTPLQYASESGYPDIVRLLLDSGAAVDIQNEDGWTPLQFASRHGYLDIVRSLLGSGAAVDSKNKYGWTSLMSASRFGHPDIVCLLVHSGAAVDSRDLDGWTPLQSASETGYPDIVRSLLESGAVVDSQNKYGWTPLMSASLLGHPRIVHLLLESGAAVDLHGQSSSTPCADINTQEVIPPPLHLASTSGHFDVAKLLIEYGSDHEIRDGHQKTPLDLASESGQLDIARLLLESGSNPNSQDSEGWSALHRAAQCGYLKIVRLLVESGADVNTSNGNNETAFDVASSSGKLDVARFLAEIMKRVDFQDTGEMAALNTAPRNITSDDAAKSVFGCGEGASTDDDEDSLFNALKEGNLVAMQNLLDEGVEVDQRGTDHETPLHWASRDQRSDAADVLIMNGANVNARDKFGWTPLHVASYFGCLDVARLLLDKGADVNITVARQNKLTHLHTATDKDHPSTVQLLLERGTDEYARDDDGMTAYSLASQQSDQEMMQLLVEYGAIAM